MLSLIGFNDFRTRINARAVTGALDDLANIREPLTARLATITNPNQLMPIGHHLLANHQPELAALVFERAKTLAPASRDAHLYLAWARLVMLNNKLVSLADPSALLTQARAELKLATTLDPIDPLTRQLTSLANQKSQL